MASREITGHIRVEAPPVVTAFEKARDALERLAAAADEPLDTALGRCQVLLQCHRETGHAGGHEAREGTPRSGGRDLEVQPFGPKRSPCADCGCALSEHHKLRCENVACPGMCNGWRCPEHQLVLCGCTYFGGPNPVGGSVDV